MSRFGSAKRLFHAYWKPTLGYSASSAALFGLWSDQKSKTDQPDRWTWKTGAFCLSKDDPITQLTDSDFALRLKKLNGTCCGEDSYSIVENSEQMVIAVADGVGGWRKRGVDPAKFSRCLMDQVGKVVTDAKKKIDILLPSNEILQKSFYGLVQVYLSGKGQPFGSSTACIVSLQKRAGILDVTNLGDSGVILLRDGEIVFKSAVQQTRFNAPYQATLRPNGNVDDMTPMADRSTVPVEHNDIVMVASDGLWDNLWEDDLIKTVSTRLSGKQPSNEMLNQLVRDLVMKARDAAASEKDSPFAKESQKAGKPYTGGKPDDITVLIAVIQDKHQSKD